MQPELPPAPTPGAATKAPPSIQDALDLLHRAYRSGPVADRVVIKASDASGKDRRVQVVVYTDVGEIAKEPPAAPAPATSAPTADKPPNTPTEPVATPKLRPAQFRIDLSQLHVHVQDATLTAVNLFDRTTYFRTPCDASPLKALAANFPSVPVPQVALAYAEGTLLTTPTPLTTGATWTSIETGVEVGRAMLILKGSSSGPTPANLTLAFDRQTNRLRRFVAEYPGATGVALAKLELTSSPADSGTPKNWLLPVEGRTKVDSPALLVPPRAGLAAGSSIKHASLMTQSLEAITPESLFEGGSASASPRAVVLITFRSDLVEAVEEPKDLVAAMRAAVGAAGKGQAVRVASVGLLGKSDLDPTKIDALVGRATKIAAAAGLTGARATLLTASEVLGVERGGQAVDAAVIVLSPDLKVLGVVVADGRSDQSGKLQEEIEAILAASVAPPAKERPGELKGSPGAK
jgi:hypothetical protein